MYKAILFDLDGVLVNMPDGHFEALNKALRLFGTEINREEHLAFFNGLPTMKKLEVLETQGRISPGLRELINKTKQKYTKEIMKNYCGPDYSKILMLYHLKHSGFKLGCCSNSIHETLELMLSSTDLLRFFDLILGNDDIKNPKPHPEIYLNAFKKMGVGPEECIIVEDAPHGVMAAEASGAHVIKVKSVDEVNLSLFKNIINFK